MSWPVASRKHDFVTAPRAYGPTGGTGPAGQVVAALVSPVAQYLNLKLVTNENRVYDASVDGLAGQNRNGPGVINNYVTLFADGCDLGIILGPTVASVADGAAPVLATKGSIGASGVYQSATGVCYRIPSGTKERLLLQPGIDLFLGVVASATGTLRLYQSSPDNA
jgi:hypothetical protein